jgi:4-amino-4-deoxy-L-arabinose transferase-like glycosyltransferase
MNNEDIDGWRRNIAVSTMQQQPVLEPPLVEYLVSIIYAAVGREEIYYSRFLTSTFWLIGGIYMYKIARELLSVDGAVFATAYYLFVPMGILVSRSFQPDSLMMMLFLASLYLLIRYFENGTNNYLLQASVVASVSLLLRPLVLFAIFGAFFAMYLQKKKDWRKIVDWPLITFSGISLLPAVVYYGYGIVFAGFMRWKIASSFMPHLLFKMDFWQEWFELGAHVVGIAFLIAGVIGFFLLRNKLARSLIIGLAISYLIFGLAFSYHIHTHGYYHIQLFPIVGICAGACLSSIAYTLRKVSGKLWLVPVILSLSITLYYAHRIVKNSLYQGRMEDPRLARQIGETIAHSPNTVFVSRYYGIPLQYYGEFGGAPWPVRIEDPFYRRPDARELSVQERIDALSFKPEYFVITDFDLFRRKHQDLQTYLETVCSAPLQTTGYLIYRDCQALSKN